MRRRQRYRRYRFPTKLIRPLILVACLAWLAWWLTPLYTIKEFSCSLGDGPCPPQIEAELNRSLGIPVWDLASPFLAQKFTAALPTIAAADISYRFPNRFHVLLQPSLPIAQLSVSSSSSTLVLSDNHRITALLATPSATLPYLITPQALSLTVGDTLEDARITRLVELAELLNQNFIPFTAIDGSSAGRVTVVLSARTQAYFDPLGPLLPQITRLQLILNQLSSQNLKTADVRLEQPVVTFGPPPVQ